MLKSFTITVCSQHFKITLEEGEPNYVFIFNCIHKIQRRGGAFMCQCKLLDLGTHRHQGEAERLSAAPGLG